MNVREELTKLLMESYDRGVKDATQAAIESIQEAMRLEREACAKVCDRMEKESDGVECCKWPTPADCAAAIRARRNT